MNFGFCNGRVRRGGRCAATPCVIIESVNSTREDIKLLPILRYLE